MSRFANTLGRVRVAAPCGEEWGEMRGDERVRFCSRCSLNVYNLSAMTRREAERLVVANEGRLCVRFYRRKDGTILTRNCPVGLARLKRRVSRVASAAAAAALGLFAGVASAPQAGQPATYDPPVILVTPPRDRSLPPPSCIVGVPIDELEARGVGEEFSVVAGSATLDPVDLFIGALTPLVILTALFTFLTWPLFLLSGEHDEEERSVGLRIWSNEWSRPDGGSTLPREVSAVDPVSVSATASTLPLEV